MSPEFDKKFSGSPGSGAGDERRFPGNVQLLLDYLQRLPVNRQRHEQQEHDALDQLLNLRLVAEDGKAAVQYRVHQRTDNDVGEARLRAAGDRQAVQHQGDQDLGFQLVAGCGRDGADLDYVDKSCQAGQRAGADSCFVDKSISTGENESQPVTFSILYAKIAILFDFFVKNCTRFRKPDASFFFCVVFLRFRTALDFQGYF